jgi:hypothetical protein
MEPHSGDIGSLILDSEGASSLKQREYHPGNIKRLSLETEGASSWRQRAPHPGHIGSHILLLNYLLALGRAYIRVLGIFTFKTIFTTDNGESLQYEARDDIDKKNKFHS